MRRASVASSRSAPTKERRADEEEIDREVGRDQERHERDVPLPFEENRADIGALRGDPIAAAVNDEEQRRQAGGNGQFLKNLLATD